MTPRHAQRSTDWLPLRTRYAMALMFGIVIGLLYSLAVFSLPAEAAVKKLREGEVIVCTVSKVRIWEDGSASCIKPSTYKWRTWNGFKVGQYIKCDRMRDIEIDNLNQRNTAQWAHCDD